MTASTDGTATIWDASDGKERLSLKGHTYRCNSAAFDRDGSRVVTTGGDGAVFVWDAVRGEKVLSLKAHTGFAETAEYSPDGSRILTGGGDNLAKVDARRCRDPDPRGPYENGAVGGLQPRRFSHPHRERRRDGPPVGRGQRHGGPRPEGPFDSVASAAFSPTGRRS
ncbi:MAG: hypothetical protein U0835_08450 [Isosphaeraceae bacterium]